MVLGRALLVGILLLGMYAPVSTQHHGFEQPFPGFYPIAFPSPLQYAPHYVTYGTPHYVMPPYRGYVTYGRPYYVTW